ncbi:uncharacterized protein LOC130370164 isoform X2 [Gadus chalcogrammus]|uniref:uncharacterized protein LOC130370164 isoform X2 n=1 Tax=Gadus chalcogrammus TaxID=1042646 RepID=UPI0024C4BFE7|nr:uncharacterized protein LOC130370164 isoform X2 [Gadus chalcogrammus]
MEKPFPFTTAMSPLSLHVVLLVFKWLPVACYSYQSKSLFMTFSELAALEKKSQDGVWVKCLQDSMEVTVVEEKADAFGLGFPVDPKRLNLGPVVQSQSRCQAEASGKGAYTFRAQHGECGTKLMISDDNIVFSNLLVYSPPPAEAGQLPPTPSLAVPVHCIYKRRYGVSSGPLKHSRAPVVPRFWPSTSKSGSEKDDFWEKDHKKEGATFFTPCHETFVEILSCVNKRWLEVSRRGRLGLLELGDG